MKTQNAKCSRFGTMPALINLNVAVGNEVSVVTWLLGTFFWFTCSTTEMCRLDWHPCAHMRCFSNHKMSQPSRYIMALTWVNNKAGRKSTSNLSFNLSSAFFSVNFILFYIFIYLFVLYLIFIFCILVRLYLTQLTYRFLYSIARQRKKRFLVQ